MYEQLIEKVEKYNSITIFKHQRCDGDALFSALGLRDYLACNYPTKRIMIAGNDIYDRYPYKEDLSSDDITGSLAIILDTANLERVDDKRFELAEEIIKIDHHPNLEPYGCLQFVDTAKAATSELLAEIMFSTELSSNKVPNSACKHLFSGILSDSLCFKTTSTTANTLITAGKLVKMGHFNPSDLVEMVFNDTLVDFQKATKLRTHLQVKGNLGYLLLNISDLAILEMTANEAKNLVHEFGGIAELNVWCIIVQNNLRTYDASLRSKRGYIVNAIGQKFSGGGHACAAGVKNLSIKEVNQLIDLLYEESIKKAID